MTDNQRKILQVYYEPRISGITRHIGDFIPPLQKRGFSFEVLCSTDDKRIADLYNAYNVKTHIAPPSRIFSFRGARQIARLLNTGEFGIVHIHNLQSLVWASIPSIKRQGVKFIFTPQVIEFENKIVENIFHIVWRSLSGLTARIIALSEKQKQILTDKKIAPPEKIGIIPNSIPPFEIEEGRPEDLQEKFGNEQFIIAVMRLVSQKAPERILNIAEKVCADFPDVRFYIVGEGPLKKDLETAINSREMLRGKVRLLGYRNDALRLLSESLFLISTARWEGMPYSLLEALFIGKPIVASDIIGHHPLVIEGETGFLAKTDDEFADQAAMLLNNRLKRDLFSRRAKRFFQERFAFDDFIDRMETLYNGLLNE